jgi:N-acetylneuraminic acid mutarotase
VPAKLQLRVWDNNNRTLTDWAQVLANGWVLRGQSLPFISRALGSNVIVPPNLLGLQSFNLTLPPGVAGLLPRAPKNLKATVASSSQIDLSWQDDATNEIGFRIERSLDSIAFAPVATNDANATALLDGGLRSNVRYYYRIRAFNGTAESSYSNTNFASTHTPFAQWQWEQFTAIQRTNSAVAGAAADPDEDRLPNFTEYVSQRSPLSSDAERPGDALVDLLPGQAKHLAIIASRNKAAIDATFSAAISSDLVTWQSGTNFVAGPIQIDETTTNLIEKFRDRTPMTPGGRRFLALNVTHSGVRDSWETNMPMPVALDEVACAVLGQRLYVVGGGSAVTLAFDLPTGKWTNLAPRPFPGNHHAAEAFNGRLYLFGGLGGNSSGRVQIYDPTTNGWSLGAPMPFAAGSCASAIINGQIYLAGGIVENSTTNGLARYNPALNTWLPLAPMPQGRNHAAAATDGGLLYVFGGRGGGNALANGSDTVQIYNFTNNTWISSATPGSLLAPLPQMRGGMGKAVFSNGEFFIFGGETSTGTGATAQRVYNRVDIYGPVSNSWRLGTPMLTARHGIYPVPNGNRIYVAGGGTAAGASSSDLFEIYIAP